MTHEAAQSFATVAAWVGGLVACLVACLVLVQCAAGLIVRRRMVPARRTAPDVDMAPVWWTIDDLLGEVERRSTATAELQAELDWSDAELAAELHDDWSMSRG